MNVNYVKWQISLDNRAQNSLSTSKWPEARLFWSMDFDVFYCRSYSIQITVILNRVTVQKDDDLNCAVILTLVSQQVWDASAKS